MFTTEMSPKSLSKMHQQPPSMAPGLPPPPEWNPWNPSWITLVGVICIFFFSFFSYYRILKRHRSNAGGAPLIRNQNRRQLLNEANPASPSMQFHSYGLDSFILHSLPTIQFQKKREGERGQGNTDCAVCLGEFKEGERLRSLPNCSHSFHVPCIDTWFQNHSNCPLCRSPVTHNSVITSITFETLRRENSIREPSGGYPVLFEGPANSTVI